jgi:hypothetical protein
MSGPKVSVYEMSARQRQNLRSQLNCLQQSIVCCEKIKRSIGYLNGINGQIQSLLSTFDLVNQRNEDCYGEIIILTDLQSSVPQNCLSFMDQLSSCAPILQVDKITLTDAELEKKKGALAKLRALQNNVATRQKEIEEALRPLKEKAKQGVSEVENAIAEDISSVQSFFISHSESDEERFMFDIKQLNEHLRVLSLGSDCPADLKGEVFSATSALSRITSKEQLETFRFVTVKPLLQRIENARLRVQEQKSEFETLQSRYVALCSVAGVQPEAFAVEINEAMSIIRNEVATLEKQVITQTEQEYISNCVNEVMSEMGYDVIGTRSVTKRSGKRFKNELYSYGEGTAINVTYDFDGQIAMELGGIDRADRIPTSEEIDVLREDMESFCSDFKDFEERLKAKGVVIKSRVSLAPPTAEYATIINVSDYNITATAPVRAITVKGTCSKSSAKRTLRREDN